MTSLKKIKFTEDNNVNSDDTDLAVPGPSGNQNNVTYAAPVPSFTEEIVNAESVKICKQVPSSSASASAGSHIKVKKNYNDNIKNFIEAKKEHDY